MLDPRDRVDAMYVNVFAGGGGVITVALET
jgi:hypothetical protein